MSQQHVLIVERLTQLGAEGSPRRQDKRKHNSEKVSNRLRINETKKNSLTIKQSFKEFMVIIEKLDSEEIG